MIRASGTPLDIQGVSQMRIRIRDADFVHKVYIVNKFHYDWVLGNDFLQKFIRKMNFIDKTMTTEPGVELTFYDVEEPTNSQLEIHLAEAREASPPNHFKCLEAQKR